jgi:hypothetical protein
MVLDTVGRSQDNWSHNVPLVVDRSGEEAGVDTHWDQRH